VYEKDGKELSAGSDESIEVRSHWNYRDRAVLVIDDKTYTIVASDLKKAIENATNT
jgi:hypothetical protein